MSPLAMQIEDSFLNNIFNALKQDYKRVGVLVSSGETVLRLGHCKAPFIGKVVNSTFNSTSSSMWTLNISRITLFGEGSFEYTVSMQTYSGIIDMSTNAIIFPRVET
jgi:hypothetical protein